MLCQTQMADSVVVIVIGIICSTILPTIGWVLQRRYESRQERKKLERERYDKKLNILWPLLMYVRRHIHLYQKLMAIHKGRVSVDKTPEDQPQYSPVASVDLRIPKQKKHSLPVTYAKVSQIGRASR